jgi:AraC-like DNA-binding protein
MLSLAVIDEKITYIIFSITDLIFIYWAGIHGLRQYTIDIPDWLNNKSVEVNHDQIKIKDNKSDITDYEYVYNIIVNKIKSDDLYKNMTLNLGNLAEACSISARRVSEAINQCGKTNFNQFINEFRIGEAKRLLSDPQYDNLSVIGIGMESGFNSKASFYTQFKKSTGLTPIQYKNTNR